MRFDLSTAANDGFTQHYATIEPGEDVIVAMRHLSDQDTMTVWSGRSDGTMTTFSIINHRGELVNYEGQDLWHIASLHSISDTRFYLVAIRRGGSTVNCAGWVYGIVDGPLLAHTQMRMKISRCMRIPRLLNLLRE